MLDRTMSQTEKEFKCEQCKLTFVSQKELEEHMRSQERAVQIFSCEKCKVTFNSKEELKKHIKEMHR